MSFKSLSWAVGVTVESPYDKLVLLLLAHHVNSKTGQCNPSIATLAIECSMSRGRVIKSLQSLEALGLISVIRSCVDGIKRVNHYKLSTGGSARRVLGVVHGVNYPSAHGELGVVHSVDINIEDEYRNESLNLDTSKQPADPETVASVREQLAVLRKSWGIKGSTP